MSLAMLPQRIVGLEDLSPGMPGPARHLSPIGILSLFCTAVLSLFLSGF